MSGDPWRDIAAGDFRALADAELARLGVGGRRHAGDRGDEGTAAVQTGRGAPAARADAEGAPRLGRPAKRPLERVQLSATSGTLREVCPSRATAIAAPLPRAVTSPLSRFGPRPTPYSFSRRLTPVVESGRYRRERSGGRVEHGVAGHGGRRAIGAVVLLLTAAAVLAGLWAGPAAAKSFSITDVTIDAVVQPNGDVSVHETRTLDFSGTFHYVYWDYTPRARRHQDHRRFGPTASSGAQGPTRLVRRSAGCRRYARHLQRRGHERRRTAQLNFALTDTTATFGVDYTALGRRQEFTTQRSSTGSSSAPTPRCRRATCSITVHLPDGVTKEPGAGPGRTARCGARHHRAGRQRGHEGRPAAARDVRGGAASCSRRRRSRKAPQQPGAKLAQALAEEKALAGPGQPHALVGARQGRLLGRRRHRRPAGGARARSSILYVRFGREPKTQFNAPVPARLPAAGPAAGARGLHLAHGQRGPRRSHRDAARPGQPRRHRPRAREWSRRTHLFGGKDKTTYKLTLHEERLGELLPTSSSS